MKTQSVQNNDRNRSFPTIVKTTATGCLAGYAAKYLLPLTDDEMDKEYHETVKLIRTHTNKTKSKYLEEIRNIPNKTLAQDTFVKMIDVSKETELSSFQRAAKMNKIRKEAQLGESDTAQLKFMMKNVNTKAKLLTEKYIGAYEGVLKKNRSLGWLLVPAGIVGFTVGLAKNILRTSSEA